jgi:hypothetical protein
VQLLGELVFDQHQRDRRRLVEADLGEDRENVVRDPEIAVLGTASSSVTGWCCSRWSPPGYDAPS